MTYVRKQLNYSALQYLI